MKFLQIILSVSLTFLASNSFAQKQDKYVLESKESSAKIEFPDKPTEQVRKVPTAAGELTLTTFVYQPDPSENDENGAYFFSYSFYPDEVVKNASTPEGEDAFFKGMFNGAANSTRGTVTSVKKIDFKGYPAREGKISLLEGKATTTMRGILVGNTVYVLQVISESQNEPNSAISGFLDSFELLK